ncbi:unnamed protein product [Protopolystoma xenopodis]|uniref:Uncharacterized protein n=1 Tax=Protopolystoma xenopodis TaxID=117903 RepID=A0A3S5A7U4_9PLAT|nr:unnamed protein product [Protopolystoma xenopodis]
MHTDTPRVPSDGVLGEEEEEEEEEVRIQIRQLLALRIRREAGGIGAKLASLRQTPFRTPVGGCISPNIHRPYQLTRFSSTRRSEPRTAKG